MVRKHILFFGRVQGVGFRYYAKIMAGHLGLTGWVKNLYDGSVEMEVQGSPLAIDKLIEYLRQQRWISITDIEKKDIPLEDEYDFQERW